MARSKSSVRIYLEYYPVRWLTALIQQLPFSWSTWISERVIRLVLSLMPKRKAILAGNIAFCFPEKSRRERHAIQNQSIHNLARGITCVSRLPELARSRFRDLVTLEGLEHIEQGIASGRGVIIFTPHFGAWELMPPYVAQLFPYVCVVARPLDNPVLDDFISGLRRTNGVHIIPHRRLLRDGIHALRQNAILGMLTDQNLSAGGVFLDVFGRLAAVTTIASGMARRTGSVVLPMHNIWKNGKVRMICEAPLRLSGQSDAALAMAEDGAAMIKIMERWIREEPGQWLWLHNRWKRRPKAGDWIYRNGKLQLWKTGGEPST